MKTALFFLGVLFGTVLTYFFLTLVWWPDVRLDAAHSEAQRLATPYPLPTLRPTPETPSLEASLGPNLGLPEDLSSPAVTGASEAAAAVVPPAAPGLAPPPESKSVELPILKSDVTTLRARALLIPVQGIESKSLRDTFADDRGGRHHEAIDILAPRGTPILAVDDGRVEKLFTSRFGGLTIYQFDGQGEYCYYYAHLDGYAAGLAEGGLVRRGDVIGYVGTTGNAPPQTPHLHFTIFRLGSEKRWWQGTAVNAYPVWKP
jgi:murein DD-endopeptidase MepM/ murein hydrolase activator NlpD